MITGLNIDNDTLLEAIRRWGTEGQFNMLQEECGELITVINHYRRGRVEKDRVAEEIADVFIMIQEVAKVIGEPIVEQKILEKFTRLRQELVESKIVQNTV